MSLLMRLLGIAEAPPTITAIEYDGSATVCSIFQEWQDGTLAVEHPFGAQFLVRATDVWEVSDTEYFAVREAAPFPTPYEEEVWRNC